jgi:hypothetical protein
MSLVLQTVAWNAGAQLISHGTIELVEHNSLAQQRGYGDPAERLGKAQSLNIDNWLG